MDTTISFYTFTFYKRNSATAVHVNRTCSSLIGTVKPGSTVKPVVRQEVKRKVK